MIIQSELNLTMENRMIGQPPNSRRRKKEYTCMFTVKNSMVLVYVCKYNNERKPKARSSQSDGQTTRAIQVG